MHRYSRLLCLLLCFQALEVSDYIVHHAKHTVACSAFAVLVNQQSAHLRHCISGGYRCPINKPYLGLMARHRFWRKAKFPKRLTTALAFTKPFVRQCSYLMTENRFTARSSRTFVLPLTTTFYVGSRIFPYPLRCMAHH